jgi:hypothetical protein
MHAMDGLIRRALDEGTIIARPFEGRLIKTPPADILNRQLINKGMLHVIKTGVCTKIGNKTIAPYDISGKITEALVTCSAYMNEPETAHSIYNDHYTLVQLTLQNYPQIFASLDKQGFSLKF